MADDFEEFDDDDFIVEDEEGQSNRPFILAVMGLLGVLLVSVIILGVFTTFSGNDTDTPSEEVAAVDSEQSAQATMISATNEAIETQNAYVTQTLESRRLTDEAPTATPTAVPPTETAIPLPTETEVPSTDEEEASAEGGDEGDEAAESADVNAEATSIFTDVNTVTPSPDDDSAVAASDGDDGNAEGSLSGDAADAAADAQADTAADASAAEDVMAVEELPDTGFGVWGAIAAALALMMLFVGARRLRVE